MRKHSKFLTLLAGAVVLCLPILVAVPSFAGEDCSVVDTERSVLEGGDAHDEPVTGDERTPDEERANRCGVLQAVSGVIQGATFEVVVLRLSE